MSDCEQYPGRLYDLCTGVGHDGRPDPSPEAVKHFAENRDSYPTTSRLRSMPAGRRSNRVAGKQPPPPPSASKIGSRLKDKFAAWVGAIPCGNCKMEISRLNRMTPEEILKDREGIISRIEINAKTATMPWYSLLVAKADGMVTGGLGVRFLIGKLLDEAVQEELHAAVIDA